MNPFLAAIPDTWWALESLRTDERRLDIARLSEMRAILTNQC
jgi:hypothetical protein